MKRPAAHGTDASLTKRRAGNIVLPAEARACGGPTELAGSALELTAPGISTEQATPARADMLDVAEAPAVMPVLYDLAIRAVEKVADRNIITSVQALGHYPKSLNSYSVAQAAGAVLSEHKLAVRLKRYRKRCPVEVGTSIRNGMDPFHCEWRCQLPQDISFCNASVSPQVYAPRAQHQQLVLQNMNLGFSGNDPKPERW